MKTWPSCPPFRGLRKASRPLIGRGCRVTDSAPTKCAHSLRAGVQPEQPVATGAAEENQQLVANELAAAVGEDGRTLGEACAVLLADVSNGIV